MGTKVFHANSDGETNRFAADLVGKRLQTLRNSGAGASLSLGGHATLGSSANRGRSEHMDLEIQPMEFSMLRKGGPENGHASDALVFQNGRLWSGAARAWRKVAFHQRPRETDLGLPLAAGGLRKAR
jgi:hypothetical protein